MKWFGEPLPHCHRPLIEIDYYGERHARARIVHIELDVARGFRDQSSGSDEKKPDPVLDSQSGFSDPLPPDVREVETAV